MRDAVLRHIRAMFQAHSEFAEFAPEAVFAEKLAVPSNTVGGQFWCVVGARESYVDAIVNDGWGGFSCSLPGSAAGDRAKVVEALAQSALAFDRVAEDVDWTPIRDELLLDLLEHEVAHQGQLIRYAYGLGLRLPKTWIDRWSLTQPLG
ncbi:MAG: hypothetical protein ABFS21_10560 [Actinomycetota bacterium]